jgi:hypothetical protein
MYRNRTSISDYYTVIRQEIEKCILEEDDATILHSDTNDLVDYYLSNNCLLPVEFDSDKEPTFEHRKEMRTVSAQEREEGYRDSGDLSFEYESIVVMMPILPNQKVKEILSLMSSTYSVSGEPEVTIGHDTLYFSFDIKGYGFKYEDDKVASKVNSGLETIKTWINWKNTDIVNENSRLKQDVRLFIEQRKDKLSQDTDRLNVLVQKINIPLKQKENPAVNRIKLEAKPLVKKVKPNPQLPEEYVLDQSKVLDIVSIIDNQGRQFEKTPRTYKAFEEESLRDVILVGLNSLFEGKATGETFSHNGKTDIYLNIDKGNVLICECKIWGGLALYHKTIDQLLGYLTWRHNFGIMITFSRQRNFSKILTEIQATITSHLSYKSEFKEENPHHFVSHHILPQDEMKKVEIHHLFYNLYSQKR